MGQRWAPASPAVMFCASLLVACGSGSSTFNDTPALACALPLPTPAAALPPLEVPCSQRSDPRLADMSDDGILLTSRLGLPSGRYALPANSAPKQLVVMFHGFGNDSCSWREHLRAAADRGAVAVAMDYSDQSDREVEGFGFLENAGWAVRSGAADSVLAAQYFLNRFPAIEEVYAFGTSMGGNVSGFALYTPEAARADCSPLWDYWIATEGVHNLSELYVGARLLGPANATAARATLFIEEENGGTIEQVPDRYNEITNVAHAQSMSTLRGVVLTHGTNDTTAPYDQSRQMSEALRAAGVPTHLYTVLGSDHVWEGNGNAAVMRLGLDELFRLLDGGEVTDDETVVQGP